MRRILILTFVIGAALISGCVKSGVNYGDFDISASWENEISHDFYFDDREGVFNSWYAVKVTSTRNDLYFRVYDKSTSSELTDSGIYGARKIGVSVFNNNAKLKSIDQSKEIEVCVSNKQDFTKNTEGIVCKSTFLPLKKVSVEVSPDPLTFQISKSSYESYLNPLYKWLTVKNTGDTKITVCVFPPSFANEKINYPKNKPQYLTMQGFEHTGGGTQPCETLKPEESSRYEIGVYIGNVGEFDTPSGVHSSQGIVGAVFGGYLGLDYAHYKKTFTLETTVTQ
jgi:hypothetical protein